jgi:hypothetical protein
MIATCPGSGRYGAWLLRTGLPGVRNRANNLFSIAGWGSGKQAAEGVSLADMAQLTRQHYNNFFIMACQINQLVGDDNRCHLARQKHLHLASTALELFNNLF